MFIIVRPSSFKYSCTWFKIFRRKCWEDISNGTEVFCCGFYRWREIHAKSAMCLHTSYCHDVFQQQYQRDKFHPVSSVFKGPVKYIWSDENILHARNLLWSMACKQLPKESLAIANFPQGWWFVPIRWVNIVSKILKHGFRSCPVAFKANF